MYWVSKIASSWNQRNKITIDFCAMQQWTKIILHDGIMAGCIVHYLSDLSNATRLWPCSRNRHQSGKNRQLRGCWTRAHWIVSTIGLNGVAYESSQTPPDPHQASRAPEWPCAAGSGVFRVADKSPGYWVICTVFSRAPGRQAYTMEAADVLVPSRMD